MRTFIYFSIFFYGKLFLKTTNDAGGVRELSVATDSEKAKIWPQITAKNAES
jgi:hypothetical protein